jgi:hypothetical protein
MVDVSEQAWDRAGEPGFDAVLAADLGRALAEKVDGQIMTGSNSSGQTLGLLNTTGALSVTADDASPTSQEIIAKLWSAYVSISNASTGQGVSELSRFALILHSRRLAFLYGNAQNSQSLRPELPGRPIPSSAVRSNLGSGTDEDEAWLIVPDMLPIFQGPVTFVASQELSGTLQVRFVARQPFATGFGRAPLSICRIAGTAFKAFTL